MRKGKQSSIAKHRQVLPIRKCRVGEVIRRTGNAEFRYAIKEEARAGGDTVVGHRYYVVEGEVRELIGIGAYPTVFHEVCNTAGEIYAYPQVISDDHMLEKGWQKCEREMFSHDLNIWTFIDYGEAGDRRYIADWEIVTDVEVGPSADFRERLDEALAPNVLSSIDHPVVQILGGLMGSVKDPRFPDDWAEIS